VRGGGAHQGDVPPVVRRVGSSIRTTRVPRILIFATVHRNMRWVNGFGQATRAAVGRLRLCSVTGELSTASVNMSRLRMASVQTALMTLTITI